MGIKHAPVKNQTTNIYSAFSSYAYKRIFFFLFRFDFLRFSSMAKNLGTLVGSEGQTLLQGELRLLSTDL